MSSLSRSNLLLIFVVSVLIVGVTMRKQPSDTKTSKEEVQNEGEARCNGTTCGCYKTKCWVYVDESATTEADWWCYAQQSEDIAGRRKKIQECEVNRNCFFDRECANCVHYKGFEEKQKQVC